SADTEKVRQRCTRFTPRNRNTSGVKRQMMSRHGAAALPRIRLVLARWDQMSDLASPLEHPRCCTPGTSEETSELPAYLQSFSVARSEGLDSVHILPEGAMICEG